MRSWLSVYFTDAKSKKEVRHTDCSTIIQLSNKMDNSLLAVRGINHKYIVVEIDIGFGCYEHAAALKPAFKVLFDNSGTVEDKMIQSRTTMDERIYGSKQKKDLETARNYAWTHLMHAAVAIKRNNYFRTVGELEFVRKIYIDLLGDRYRLESTVNREIDKLPDHEKEAIRSTYITDDSQETLWTCLMKLTDLIYKELEGCSVPIPKEMLDEYYRDINE